MCASLGYAVGRAHDHSVPPGRLAVPGKTILEYGHQKIQFSAIIGSTSVTTPERGSVNLFQDMVRYLRSMEC